MNLEVTHCIGVREEGWCFRPKLGGDQNPAVPVNEKKNHMRGKSLDDLEHMVTQVGEKKLHWCIGGVVVARRPKHRSSLLCGFHSVGMGRKEKSGLGRGMARRGTSSELRGTFYS